VVCHCPPPDFRTDSLPCTRAAIAVCKPLIELNASIVRPPALDVDERLDLAGAPMELFQMVYVCISNDEDAWLFCGKTDDKNNILLLKPDRLASFVYQMICHARYMCQ